MRCPAVAVFLMCWGSCACVIAATPDRTALTKTELASVSSTTGQTEPWTHWGLSRADWQRYEVLLTGPRGVWSPDLDPITLLGIEAESLDEQRRFAQLYIELEAARVVKETRFQRLLNTQRARYYAHIPVAAPDTNPQADTYALFISALRCEEDCRTWLNRGMSLVNTRNVTLNIYLSDTANERDVRAWAIQKSIPMKQLYDGQVVLHREAEQYGVASAKVKEATFPMLVAMTEDGVERVVY